MCDACPDPCRGALTSCSNDVLTMNWNFYDLYLWSTTMTMTCACLYLCPHPSPCLCPCHVASCCSCAPFSDPYPYRDRNGFYREKKKRIFSQFLQLHWSKFACLCRACVHDLCLCSMIYENYCYVSLCRGVYLCCCYRATTNACSLFARNNLCVMSQWIRHI